MRSFLGGETYAVADCFDAPFILKHDLKKIMGTKLPIKLLTDSGSLFKIMLRSTTTTGKRLIIGVRATREAFESEELSNIGWIKTKKHLRWNDNDKQV